jgi:Cytochrome P460
MTSKKYSQLLGVMMILTLAGAMVGMAKAVDAEYELSWGPKWTQSGELILPDGYHEWVFLGSPLTPHALNGGKAAFPEYHNVYVQPEAYRSYRRKGRWPEGTILLKELQLTRPGDYPDGSSVEVSGRGFFPGALNGIDISVKDSKRFNETNSWGFFNFGHHAPPYASSAAALPADACANCHIANADNMVFSKFYSPILDGGNPGPKKKR